MSRSVWPSGEAGKQKDLGLKLSDRQMGTEKIYIITQPRALLVVDHFYIRAFLPSRTDLLRSHVIHSELLAFSSAFLNIQRSGVLTALFGC